MKRVNQITMCFKNFSIKRSNSGTSGLQVLLNRMDMINHKFFLIYSEFIFKHIISDEVLEVNGLKLCGKSVHDICSTLCQMSGTLTFVIIPAQPANQKDETSQPVVRSLKKDPPPP